VLQHGGQVLGGHDPVGAGYDHNAARGAGGAGSTNVPGIVGSVEQANEQGL
jgi:hypothetical protein